MISSTKRTDGSIGSTQEIHVCVDDETKDRIAMLSANCVSCVRTLGIPTSSFSLLAFLFVVDEELFALVGCFPLSEFLTFHLAEFMMLPAAKSTSSERLSEGRCF